MTVNAAEAAEQQVEQIQATAQPSPAEQQQLQKSKNALQANIEEKRDQSYYYAHAPRSTSEEPAPPPVPVVLDRSMAVVPPTPVTIFNYAWADEGDVVKVYVPMEALGARCTDDDIKATFEARLFQVDVHGFKPRQVHRLLVQKLSGDIDPEHCCVRRLANKLLVTLKKASGSTHKWYNLRTSA